MNKTGQFYLIAAFIIIIIFAGLKHVYTSVRTSSDTEHFYDLADEIYFEGNQLIINKILSGNDGDIIDSLKTIRDYYKNGHTNIEVFLFYNRQGVDNSEQIDSKCRNKFCVVLKAKKEGEEIKIVK